MIQIADAPWVRDPERYADEYWKAYCDGDEDEEDDDDERDD